METVTAPRLHPLGIGEMLDQAIRIYRSNFIKFIGIIAIVQIPINVLNLVLSLVTTENMAAFLRDSRLASSNPFEMLGPGYLAGMGGSCILMIVSLLLVQGAATAALTRAVTDHYLGAQIGIASAYRKISDSWLRLAGAVLLAIICSLGLMIWLLIPCIGWVTGPGMVFFLSMVIVPLIAPIVVLERQTALNSIRRAWDLVRRRFWWVVGFVALLAIFGQIVITGPVTIMNLAVQFLTGDMLTSGDISTGIIIQTVVQSLVTLVFTLIYTPLQLTCMTLLYFDLRVRTEGFDLTLLAEGAQGEQIDISEVVAQAPPPETTPLVTGTEMGYFVLVSIGAAGVVAAVMAFSGAVGLLMAGGGMFGP